MPTTVGMSSLSDDAEFPAGEIPTKFRQKLSAMQGAAMNDPIVSFEGFGSFHSGNVEDIISTPDHTYKPPGCMPYFAKRVLGRSELQAVARLRMKMRSDDNKSARGSLCEWNCTDSGVVPEVAAPNVSPMDAEGPSTTEGNTENDDGSESDSIGAHFLDRPSFNSAVEAIYAKPTKTVEFGQAFLKEYFTVTPDYVFVNHGAFGGSLVGSMDIKRRYEDLMEAEVVSFMDRQLLPLIVHSIRRLAQFLHADPKHIVLMQNATFGLNCAMRLIEQNDVVAFLDTEYLSVYKMMYYRCKEVGATFHEIPLSRYLHDSETMGDDASLTALICDSLPEGCTTIIFDYITSTSALCFPVFTHLIPALKERGVTKIIVDGAHAPLQIDLNFAALPPASQPSVFIGNLHKWFSSPKAVGFMWVRPDVMNSVHSVVLSHGAGDGLLSEFIWDGTRDYGAYLAIPAIVDFWEAQDTDRVRRHCSQLLRRAAEMLTAAFGSRPVARHSPFMALVELPEALQDDVITTRHIQDVLFSYYKIEVPVKRVEGRYYIRLSAFVYNSPSDYAYVREAVLSLASRWSQSSFKKHSRVETGEADDEAQDAAEGGDRMDKRVKKEPCSERIRRAGGCGISGLDPDAKRKKTSKF